METAAGFDVVAVVAAVAGMDVEVASRDELWWADRAVDRVRSWLDARQAEVSFRLTLPPPLPPGPNQPAAGGDADVGLDDDGHPDGDPAGEAGDQGGGQPNASDGGGPVGDAGADPTGDGWPASGSTGAWPAGALPSLGSPAAAGSPQEMLRKARRSRLLALLPAFREALAAARVSTDHVDRLAAALERLPEPIHARVVGRGEELLRAACQCSADRFGRAIARVVAKAYDNEGIDRTRRQRAQSGLRCGIDQTTGMHWLRVDIDPERGAALFERLRNEREAIFHTGGHTGLTSEQVDLHALLNLLAAPGAQQQSSPKRVHLSVIVDIATLTLGAHDRTICETRAGQPLPPDTARRLLCAAEVSFGFTIHGRVVHHVANAQLATKDQRRQLRMEHRTCAGPDCTRPFDHCQVHHIIPRSRGGPTDTTLMVPLCSRCHDKIHHHGWQLTIDPDKTITWTTPRGHTTEHPFTGLTDPDCPNLFDTPPPAAA